MSIKIFASGGQGGRFLKKLPPCSIWTPPQKLLIKGGHGLQLERIQANHDRLWFVEDKKVNKRIEGFDTLWGNNFLQII
jgi:hypothetical protein